MKFDPWVTRSISIRFLLSIVAPVQQRFSSHGPPVDEIGPPACFNQLPQPEGDWAELHAQKQKKYNLVLAAAAVFFTGTVVFVSEFEENIFNKFPFFCQFKNMSIFFLYLCQISDERIRNYIFQC